MTMKQPTKKQIAHFLTLFMEKCWHIDGGMNQVSFPEVMTYMEKEKPEMWEEYLEWIRSLPLGYPEILFLKAILDLSNLFTFLDKNRDKWGWKKCPVMDGIDCDPHCGPESSVKFTDRGCYKKHPALEYLEKEGE